MKKGFAFGLAVFFALILTLISFPCAASAQTADGESNQLSLTAVYFDEQGKRADGNVLTEGNYRMQLVLSGFAQISEMEFTASYNSSVTVNGNTAVCDAAAASADISSLCKIEDGSIIICLVSLNDNCSSIASDGAVIFSADITVSSSVPLDMENVITENENPNYTFVEKDYGEIDKAAVPYAYNCYGFASGKPADYAGSVTDMLFDMSPELSKSYSVKGKVVAMLDPLNPDAVINGGKGTPVVLAGVTVTVDNQVAVTDESGVFTLSLENGTYEAILHYANGFDRKIVIIVNDASIDYTDKPITMVPCDYDNNGYVNYADTISYLASVKSDDKAIGDLNSDSYVNYQDTLIYFTFVKLTDVRNIYPEVIIG